MFALRTIAIALLCANSVVARLPNPDGVNLGSAGDFAVLSKVAISTIPDSVIAGDIGVSPSAASYMTGFSFTSHDDHSTSQQVSGKAYAADQAGPISLKMATATADMDLAYSDAASRSVADPSALNVQGGLITGVAFLPGVYHWDTDINLAGAIHLHPSSDASASTDRFIFQTTGNIIAATGSQVVLGAGIKPGNIVWQSAGYVEVGASSKMKGVFLSNTHATFLSESSLDGRILAQTTVTLHQNTITEPEEELMEFPADMTTPDGFESDVEDDVVVVIEEELLHMDGEVVDVVGMSW